MTYRYVKPPSQRQLQIAENIKHIIALMLVKGELNHPFFEKHMISVSEVRISPDLRLATAFMVFPDDIDQKALLKLFEDLSPMIRKFISKNLVLRFAPQIRFSIDESIKKAAQIEKIMGKIANR